jgi:hypothetical protein
LSPCPQIFRPKVFSEPSAATSPVFFDGFIRPWLVENFTEAFRFSRHKNLIHRLTLILTSASVRESGDRHSEPIAQFPAKPGSGKALTILGLHALQ